MNLYKKLILPLAAIVGLGAFSSCSEDDTLEGADAVYLEITPSDITIKLGDTVAIGASVTNVSGRQIKTPIQWSIDREEGTPEIVQILGDSALVAVEGSVGRSTRLRATLQNGKYALASVKVVANTPEGVVPVDTAGVYMPRRISYDIAHDSVVFKITPKLLLRDYTPTYELTGEGLVPYERQPMYIDYEAGTVAIHYSAPRKAGLGSVAVSIGEGASAMTGSCVIRMDAPIEGATFYGPDYAGMPYIESRPALHTLEMYYATTYERNLDVNHRDTCRVAVNVQTGAETDILEAYKSCGWTCLEGSSVMVVDMYNEFVDGNGFDAVLVVASGINRGQTRFQFTTPRDTLAATFNVNNFAVDFPVNEITVDKESIEILSGQMVMLTTGVVPASSYAYHKPVVKAADPTVVSVGKYVGNQISVTGLKEGETILTLTANGKSKTVSVKVKEGVRQVLWKNSSDRRVIFAGESIEWAVNVVTPSGAQSEFPVEWSSSDKAVATVANGSANDAGVITGVAEGKADIRAKVLNQQSDARSITVLPRPTDMTITNTEYMEAYSEGSNLYLVMGLGAGAPYGDIAIEFPGVYGGDFNRTYSVVQGSTVTIDNIVVALTGGSLTFKSAGDDRAIVSGSVTFNINGIGNVTITIPETEIDAYEA